MFVIGGVSAFKKHKAVWYGSIPCTYPCKLVENIFTSATTERTPNLRTLRQISWTRIFQNHFFRNHIFQKHISHLPKIRSCQMHFSYIVNCISSIFVVLTDEGHVKYPSSEDLKKSYNDFPARHWYGLCLSPIQWVLLLMRPEPRLPS